MFSRIRRLFKAHPLITNTIACGVTYTAAEASQQLILMREDPEKKIDWEILAHYAIVSTVAIAPLLYYWFKYLDVKLPRSTYRALLFKTIVNQAVAGSGTLVVFFIGMGILERREDIFAELKAKFVSTYAKSCLFWLPAQFINFGFLPPYTRVAFVGVASFIWVNILCLIKRQEFVEEDIKKKE